MTAAQASPVTWQIDLTEAERQAIGWALDLAAVSDCLKYLHPDDAANVKALAERFKY